MVSHGLGPDLGLYDAAILRNSHNFALRRFGMGMAGGKTRG